MTNAKNPMSTGTTSFEGVVLKFLLPISQTGNERQ